MHRDIRCDWRRDLVGLQGMVILAIVVTVIGARETVAQVQPPPHKLHGSVQQWDMREIELSGPSARNPFVDIQISATFEHNGVKQRVAGFYDGNGTYRIRFMPGAVGHWQYKTESNTTGLAGATGEFDVVPVAGNNHGPVQVRSTYHFAYADGTPYRQLGTTCYAWTSQSEELEQQTLETLATAPFNKLRMCVFPKRYTWNQNEPPHYAFEGTPPDRWDFSRFNPKFFHHLEQRIGQLRDLEIEADLILFHPYDEGHWGFDRMPDEVDDHYLRYVISRLAAYRNVWWSLANEYDFMTEKQESDWDRMIQVVHDSDPYHRLMSIHNGRLLYNHTNPLLSHASIQNGSAAEEAGRAILYRDAYRKPIVFDEIKYEGDIPLRWGNLSAEEMVHRFWECIIAGTYPGHGECYLHPTDVLWWAKGGVLRGQSPPRIAFLRDILAAAPAADIDPIDKWQVANVAGVPGEFYLVYFGANTPREWKFQLPRRSRDEETSELAGGMRFRVDVLDTWNMTISAVDGPFELAKPASADYVATDAEGRSVSLPQQPWIALRITRVKD